MNASIRKLSAFHLSSRLRYAFWLAVSLFIFFALFDLTMLLSIDLSLYFFAAILIYIALLPALSAVRNSKVFFAIFPTLLLGSWAMSVFYLSSFTLPPLPSSAIASAIPTVLTISVHLETRMRNIVFRRTMTSFARISLGLSSTIFFLIAPIVLTPVHIELNPIYVATLFILLQLAYVFSSMHLLNTAYRYRILCLKLSVSSIERRGKEIWQNIESKFFDQKRDVDLLRYYYMEAINSFEEGAYEDSFRSGYQMICEETVVDPKTDPKYRISDKRDGKPESFSEIRTILMHSRRKETEIDVKRIQATKKRIPQYCIELLDRDFAFLDKLATSSDEI